jgi:hypothetical protein
MDHDCTLHRLIIESRLEPAQSQGISVVARITARVLEDTDAGFEAAGPVGEVLGEISSAIAAMRDMLLE